MLDFNVMCDEQTGALYIETSISGKHLLTLPQLNKSTAFTNEERQSFGLLGKLPNRVETLEEQVRRTYLQFSSYTSHLQKNIYLNNLNDKNQILFYELVRQHLGEMLPIIYTPIVGTAVKRFSHEYRQPRGLYLTHTDENQLADIIKNRSNPEIDVIVVTDGEGVLGIGDQGIGGMDIPVAKLMVYSLCGGINPLRTLPIFLDTGTNNQELLNDPFYLGCRHPRIPTEKYDAFIDKFVQTIQANFPNAFLHWEDFGRANARRILNKYQHTMCSFNDDIQGTGAVTLAALLAAVEVTNLPLQAHRIIIFGAGSAGTGIGDQIVDALKHYGLTEKEAYDRFWLIDRQGLLLENDDALTDAQKPYARSLNEITDWQTNDKLVPSLSDTVKHIQPTILIGCSAQPGAFSQDIIETMALNCDRPIIFPLSNPDEKCEAQPENILQWSHGKALIATGTAFPAVEYQNRLMQIAQCNNALVFPGIGLGVLAAQARFLSPKMILAAAHALSHFSPSRKDSFLPLLPLLGEAQTVAKHIALAVANAAIDEELAPAQSSEDIEQRIHTLFWEPRYLPFKKRAVRP